MTTLKEEEPFAAVVKTEHLGDTCSFCFTQDEDSVHRCKGCLVVSYCNRECQQKDWIDHKNECRLLKKERMESDSVPSEFIRLVSRILLKSEKELAQKAFNKRSWGDLIDHIAKVNPKQSPSFYKSVDYTMAFMKPVKSFSREEVAKAFSKVITYNIGIFENKSMDIIGNGIYLGFSIHPHSCLPDAQIIFTGRMGSFHPFQKEAVYSSNLTISYTSLMPWCINRTVNFKCNYFYDCTCPLCTDKNHIMNRMGSSCYVSCCQDAAGILDENSSGPYKCNKCGTDSPMPIYEVTRAQDIIKAQLEENALSVRNGLHGADMIVETINLLHSLEKILSVYNFYLLNLYFSIRSMAKSKQLFGLGRYVQDMSLKSYEYYLHDTDIFKAAALKIRSYLKFAFHIADDFDYKKALEAAVRTFGTDHPFCGSFRAEMGRHMVGVMLYDIGFV